MAHVPRSVAHAARRLSPRRAWDAILNLVDAHDLTRPIAVLALLLVAAGAFVVLATLGEDERRVANADRSPVEERRPSPFVNRPGGYGISVPETWNVSQDGPLTRVASPNGRVVVTFERGSAGELEEASARLLASLLDAQSDQTLIGRTWERIGGSRSLLVSGTATESGRAVRFLAIAVKAQPRNYAITITVPTASDPATVLPRLERLLSSFEILGSSPEFSL